MQVEPDQLRQLVVAFATPLATRDFETSPRHIVATGSTVGSSYHGILGFRPQSSLWVTSDTVIGPATMASEKPLTRGPFARVPAGGPDRSL